MSKDYFFDIMNITNAQMKNYRSKGMDVDHECVAKSFMEYLKNDYSDEELCNLIACAGFIPDVYESDSSDETLFTKLIEVLVAEWATRMGYTAHFVKEKASYEDVNIVINEETVVCDAKSFRLGRSQGAPNVKDFLKLEDIRKWLSRHDNQLGGLVTYPDTHEWSKGSDAYLYCSTKDCPTVMLPYIYLALLLHFKNNFNTANLSNLWDYERLFPKALPKKCVGGNQKKYWDVINNEIIRIIGISKEDFDSYINECKKLQLNCIKSNYKYIENVKKKAIIKIKSDEEKMTEAEVRKDYIECKTFILTNKLDKFLENIKRFRLKNK